MIRFLLSAFGAAFLCLPAFAQQPIVNLPSQVTTVNASNTIAATGTFQQVFAAVSNDAGATARLRQGCTIQNNSATNPMYVFSGPLGSATTAKSLKLAPAAQFTCAVGNTSVATDQISVSGTLGDVFYAAQQ